MRSIIDFFELFGVAHGLAEPVNRNVTIHETKTVKTTVGLAGETTTQTTIERTERVSPAQPGHVVKTGDFARAARSGAEKAS